MGPLGVVELDPLTDDLPGDEAIGRCCQTNANSSQFSRIIKQLCGTKVLPFGKCNTALQFEIISII